MGWRTQVWRWGTWREWKHSRPGGGLSPSSLLMWARALVMRHVPLHPGGLPGPPAHSSAPTWPSAASQGPGTITRKAPHGSASPPPLGKCPPSTSGAQVHTEEHSSHLFSPAQWNTAGHESDTLPLVLEKREDGCILTLAPKYDFL